MEVRVPPVALEVGRRVTAHLKWPFMENEITQTGPIQSIQALGPAYLVRVNDVDFFATGMPESPAWFTDYDPPALPEPVRMPRLPRAAPLRAATPPARSPEFKTGETPVRRSQSGNGTRTRKGRRRGSTRRRPRRG